MKFIKATCPGCGASLELADHLQSANCPNCGTKIVLEKQTKPEPPTANLQLAKTYIQMKNFVEADKLISTALEKNPGNKEAWLLKWLCTSEWQRDGSDGAPQVDATKYFEQSGYMKSDIPQIYARYLTGWEIFLHINRWTGDDFDRQLWDAAQKAEREPLKNDDLVWPAREQLSHHFHKYIERDTIVTYQGVFYGPGKHSIEKFSPGFLFDLLGAASLEKSVDLTILEFDWRGRAKEKVVSMKLGEWLTFVVEYDRKYGGPRM